MVFFSFEFNCVFQVSSNCNWNSFTGTDGDGIYLNGDSASNAFASFLSARSDIRARNPDEIVAFTR